MLKEGKEKQDRGSNKFFHVPYEYVSSIRKYGHFCYLLPPNLPGIPLGAFTKSSALIRLPVCFMKTSSSEGEENVTDEIRMSLLSNALTISAISKPAFLA